TTRSTSPGSRGASSCRSVRSGSRGPGATTRSSASARSYGARRRTSTSWRGGGGGGWAAVRGGAGGPPARGGRAPEGRGASVAGEAARGLADVSRRFDVPLAFGVLTTDTMEQALARAGGTRGNKGYEAAVTSLEMVQLLRAAQAF